MIAYFLGGLGGGVLITVGMYYWNVGRHKRIPSLTKYVVFSIAILLIYSIAEFTEASINGISHDTLTTCLYACFGGEILSCALIKIFKLKEENHE
jgi:hypothetical protein